MGCPPPPGSYGLPPGSSGLPPGIPMGCTITMFGVDAGIIVEQISFFIVVEEGDDCLRSCSVGREHPDVKEVLRA